MKKTINKNLKSKTQSGISLVALVVTIVVLLILAGISVVIANKVVVDKAVMATSATEEAYLQENIEIAWGECEIAYLEEKNQQPGLDRNEYFKENFLSYLKNIKNLDNVKTKLENNCISEVSCSYKNQEYDFDISEDGKVSLANLLKGNVKVGDYVEYSIEYHDAYSSQYYTATNGWRVLDDGTMDGTEGIVKLVSSGIPAKWYYSSDNYDNNSSAQDYLKNDFETIKVRNGEGQSVYGSSYKTSIAKKASVLSLNELNIAYNNLYNKNRELYDRSELDSKDDMFVINDSETCYWLASKDEDNDKNLLMVDNGNISSEYDFRLGIRVVVYLNEDLEGNFDSGVWKIIE